MHTLGRFPGFDIVHTLEDFPGSRIVHTLARFLGSGTGHIHEDFPGTGIAHTRVGFLGSGIVHIREPLPGIESRVGLFPGSNPGLFLQMDNVLQCFPGFGSGNMEWVVPLAEDRRRRGSRRAEAEVDRCTDLEKTILGFGLEMREDCKMMKVHRKRCQYLYLLPLLLCRPAPWLA